MSPLNESEADSVKWSNGSLSDRSGVPGTPYTMSVASENDGPTSTPFTPTNWLRFDPETTPPKRNSPIHDGGSRSAPLNRSLNSNRLLPATGLSQKAKN